MHDDQLSKKYTIRTPQIHNYLGYRLFTTKIVFFKLKQGKLKTLVLSIL